MLTDIAKRATAKKTFWLNSFAFNLGIVSAECERGVGKLTLVNESSWGADSITAAAAISSKDNGRDTFYTVPKEGQMYTGTTSTPSLFRYSGSPQHFFILYSPDHCRR